MHASPVFIAALMVGLMPALALAGTPVFVGKKAASQQSMNEVDHSGWDALLKRYVDEDGLVNYRGWHKSTADRKALDNYLAELSTGSLSAPADKSAKLAFWINAYNAVTVKGILQQYPTTSIRNHTPRLFGFHIWHDLKLYVAGKPYSLDQIEHQVLRKMSEPRIHFAIVCASIGCPRLLNHAYVAGKLDEQLTTNAQDFFSRKRNFRYAQSENRFYLSSILSWFGEDFGRDQKAQLRKIAKWLPTTASQQAARGASVRVSYVSYDWDLNKQ
ncbi:MAG: DUF547 domain-containing protein [Planctomycetota bacterium]